MDAAEWAKQAADLNRQQARAAHELIEPARAAYNTLMDAGMTRTAAPLGELLLKIDTLKQDLEALLKDPNWVEGIILLMGRR